jgi:DNA polymerase-1
MLALIDGDIVAYRVGWTTENDDFPIARFRADEMLDGILLDTGATEFTVWLSDRAENNFRYKIYPEYKANRKDLPRPRHLEALKEYLITRWGARIALGMEADDALGIEQCRTRYDDKGYEILNCTTTICSIDKDLQQIPGNHYNFVKKEHSFVTPEEAIQNFYKQILTGDTADNIKGAKGIGPVRAGKIIGPLGSDIQAIERAVFETYFNSFQITTPEGSKEISKYITKIGQVLKIRQQEDEPLWHFQQENLMQESQSLSSLKKQEVVGPSLEPTTQAMNGFHSLGEKMDKSLKITKEV